MATRKTPAKARPPRIEKERLQFKELLLGNANYFGGASAKLKLPVVKKMEGNTKYESVSCIGYGPDRRLLEATVLVKLPYGYGGDLCSNGSTEFVRFYVDTGGGWVDAERPRSTHTTSRTTRTASAEDEATQLGADRAVRPTAQGVQGAEPAEARSFVERHAAAGPAELDPALG